MRANHWNQMLWIDGAYQPEKIVHIKGKMMEVNPDKKSAVEIQMWLAVSITNLLTIPAAKPAILKCNDQYSFESGQYN